jgi:hypothetical protein
MLIQSHGFLEYIEAVLLDERSSLNNSIIMNFLMKFLPQVNTLTMKVVQPYQSGFRLSFELQSYLVIGIKAIIIISLV